MEPLVNSWSLSSGLFQYWLWVSWKTFGKLISTFIHQGCNLISISVIFSVTNHCRSNVRAMHNLEKRGGSNHVQRHLSGIKIRSSRKPSWINPSETNEAFDAFTESIPNPNSSEDGNHLQCYGNSHGYLPPVKSASKMDLKYNGYQAHMFHHRCSHRFTHSIPSLRWFNVKLYNTKDRTRHNRLSSTNGIIYLSSPLPHSDVYEPELSNTVVSPDVFEMKLKECLNRTHLCLLIAGFSQICEIHCIIEAIPRTHPLIPFLDKGALVFSWIMRGICNPLKSAIELGWKYFVKNSPPVHSFVQSQKKMGIDLEKKVTENLTKWVRKLMGHLIKYVSTPISLLNDASAPMPSKRAMKKRHSKLFQTFNLGCFAKKLQKSVKRFLDIFYRDPTIIDVRLNLFLNSNIYAQYQS